MGIKRVVFEVPPKKPAVRALFKKPAVRALSLLLLVF